MAFVAMAMSAAAQTAIQTPKTFDNVSLGITVGATTPLDMNSVFPINANVGLRLDKMFTPTIGAQVEGLAILNDNHFADFKTMVKSTNLGGNVLVNLNNLILGYKGIPRTLEFTLVSGLGWLHTFDYQTNFLTAKEGLDIALNLGKKKANKIVLTPAVYFNLNKGGDIQFNKHNAQLGVSLGFVHNFKCSNGTHSFKTYDVCAMIDEIGRLNEELAKKPPIVEKIKETVIVKEKNVKSEVVVFFEKNSYDLDDAAKQALKSIAQNEEVTVEGTASPEGGEEFNQKLSERRAATVADFLTKNGVKVKSFVGKGVIGKASNRVAIVRCN